MFAVRPLLVSMLVATIVAAMRMPQPMDSVKCNCREALIGAGTLAAAATAATTTVSPAVAINGINNTPTIPTWRLSGLVNFPVLALNTAGLSKEATSRGLLKRPRRRDFPGGVRSVPSFARCLAGR